MTSTLASPFTPAETASPNGSASPPPEPEMTRVTVTPEMAQQWAERNTRNRPVRYGRVARFARDMTAGNWTLNGETIKFDVNSDIIDGQHRIYACIQAGVPFESLVVTGLPPEVQDTVDTGASRTMADQFTLRGEPYGPLLAAVTRWAYLWLHGARGGRGHSASSGDPSHSEMSALLAAEPRLRDAAAWADGARKAPLKVRASVWGMAWLLFHGSDHLAAEVFLKGAVTGEDLSAGDPALAFRNRMLTAKGNDERMGQWEQLGYLIMAWNAFRDERTLTRLQPPRGGFSPKNFPEPR